MSAVYLLDRAHSSLYRPPRHSPGASDIGFAFAENGLAPRDVVRGMLGQIAAAYREGNEIGSHWGGHFCLGQPGNVSEWDAADWTQELNQFNALLFDANARMGLRPRVPLPFDVHAVVGERTPCLEGDLKTLYPVLRRARLPLRRERGRAAERVAVPARRDLEPAARGHAPPRPRR